MSKESRLTSIMLEEAREAPARIADLLAADADLVRDLAARLRADRPRFAVTIARGSSDHAATYAAYLLGSRLGVVTASLPPSLETLGHSDLDLKGSLAIAVSQSGRSPDLVTPVRRARERGALTVAVLNSPNSPAAQAAEVVLDQHAGRERAVAATKSYIASLVVAARLVAEWAEDAKLKAALQRLPEALEAATRCDWSPAVEALAKADRMMVAGRGLNLAIAQESALKFKETCILQAEAMSAAEIMHGPKALVETGYPVLAYAPNDGGRESVLKMAAEFRGLGANVLLAGAPGVEGATLPLPPPLHPALDPVLAIGAFYPFVAALSEARGLSPDAPRNLSKVTETV
jgi:glucosamine--fructose-6-phosphate aminotransferase (isomerizing)